MTYWYRCTNGLCDNFEKMITSKRPLVQCDKCLAELTEDLNPSNYVREGDHIND